MLKIFNDLAPFFKDCYQRINVRQYAKMRKISPPTASTLLSSYEMEGLLKVERRDKYIYYYANNESKLFIELSREYWRIQVEKAKILQQINDKLIADCIVLFGSFSKAEIHQDSDIDIAIFTPSKNELDFEKNELGRKIQLFVFKDLSSIKNNDLKKNILNGYIIYGGW